MQQSTNMMLTQFITLPQLFSCSTLLCLAICTLNTPSSTNASPLFPDGVHNMEVKRYCSSNLNDIINEICGERTNSMGNRFPDSFGGSSFRGSFLRSLLPQERVYYRPLENGPIHECCKRPCGYADLRMYCASK